jgi:hypothetical protein
MEKKIHKVSRCECDLGEHIKYSEALDYSLSTGAFWHANKLLKNMKKNHKVLHNFKSKLNLHLKKQKEREISLALVILMSLIHNPVKWLHRTKKRSLCFLDMCLKCLFYLIDLCYVCVSIFFEIFTTLRIMFIDVRVTLCPEGHNTFLLGKR